MSQLRGTIVLALFALSLTGWADDSRAPSPTITISLEEVSKKVSSQNYTVLANAQKVYQAKEAIKVARGNLLPKLNIWKWVGAVVNPATLVDTLIGNIEDIAPFLIPNNWFRLEQEKILYQAQKEGYRALWANEVMTAKTLYVHALVDESLYRHLEESEKELRDILQIVQARETLGGAKQGASKEIEVRLLALQEDKRSLDVVIRDDKTLVALMMGYPGNSDVNLTPVSMPSFDQMVPINYDIFEFRALDLSPEIKQFGHYIHAADYMKKERAFSFLGASSMSRGAGGGIFDDLPMQDGLGFGTGASIRIAKAQKEILKLQKKGLEETIRRTLKLLVENYNLDLEAYTNLKRRSELTEEMSKRLYQRLLLGDDVDAFELIEASRNHIQAEIAFFAVQYRFLATEDRLARLIFHGEYGKMPEPVFTTPDDKKERK